MATNEITGTVPSELGLLTGVTSGGSFGDNNFLNFLDLTGSVPTELGQLTSFVEHFELRENGFTVLLNHNTFPFGEKRAPGFQPKWITHPCATESGSHITKLCQV